MLFTLSALLLFCFILLVWLQRDNNRLKANATTSAIEKATAETRTTEYLGQITTLSNELAQKATELNQLKEEYSKLSERIKFIEEEKERLTNESELRFKNLAIEILANNTQTFKEQNETRLSEILAPFKENIEQFKRTITESYSNEARERFSLQEKIKVLREDIGKYVAQSYIEHILKDERIYEEVVPEIQYKIGRQTIDAPDIMIKDNDVFCFIDSKLSTPKLSLRNFNETDLEKNIKQYAKNVCQIYNRINDFLDGKYYPFSSAATIDRSKVFGIVVVFENAYIFKSKILAEVFEKLKIDSESDEATYIKANIYITDLSDIENIASGSGNIFSALVSKRDDPKRWDDMGLYSDVSFNNDYIKTQSMLAFETKIREVLKENIAQMIQLQILPNPPQASY